MKLYIDEARPAPVEDLWACAWTSGADSMWVVMKDDGHDNKDMIIVADYLLNIERLSYIIASSMATSTPIWYGFMGDTVDLWRLKHKEGQRHKIIELNRKTPLHDLIPSADTFHGQEIISYMRQGTTLFIAGKNSLWFTTPEHPTVKCWYLPLPVEYCEV